MTRATPFCDYSIFLLFRNAFQNFNFEREKEKRDSSGPWRILRTLLDKKIFPKREKAEDSRSKRWNFAKKKKTRFSRKVHHLTLSAMESPRGLVKREINRKEKGKRKKKVGEGDELSKIGMKREARKGRREVENYCHSYEIEATPSPSSNNSQYLSATSYIFFVSRNLTRYHVYKSNIWYPNTRILKGVV